MKDKLQLEDTVSADRKERIIFDPEAWRKSDKSGRKTSAITSRQNFDNEKFTRKNKGEQVEEGYYKNMEIDKMEDERLAKQNKDQPKSNNSQIKFVTGTEKAGSSSTATGNAQMNGVKKISEALVKKAMTKIKADKNVGVDEAPFDVDSSAEKQFKKPNNPTRSPMDTVRALAQKAIKKQQVKEDKYAGLEKEDKPGKIKTAAIKTHEKAVGIDTVEGWKDADIGFKHTKTTAVKEVKEETEQIDEVISASTPMGDVIKDFQKSDAPQFKGKSQGKRREMAIAAKLSKQDATNEETEMSKTYKQFVDQLLEYTPGPGGVTRVQGRSYGAQYHDPEGADDADDKPTAKVEAPKRGRGRPKGATSGANHKVTSGKKTGGVDYTGFKLHLPNSNR